MKYGWLSNNCESYYSIWGYTSFVDISIDTLNINTDLIDQAITSKTKAIMIAHTLGNPFRLDEISHICKKNNLWLVEDCCDALGSTFNNKHVGTFGDMATLVLSCSSYYYGRRRSCVNK